MAAYSMNLGSVSITMAELWAVYISLKLTFNLEVIYLLIQIDSLGVVKLFQQHSLNHHSSLSLISAIKEIIMCDWIVKIYHIYKEANHRVDLLAKMVHSKHLGVSFYYDSIPALLSNAYLGDVSRACFLVVVSM